MTLQKFRSDRSARRASRYLRDRHSDRWEALHALERELTDRRVYWRSAETMPGGTSYDERLAEAKAEYDAKVARDREAFGRTLDGKRGKMKPLRVTQRPKKLAPEPSTQGWAA